MGIKAVELNFDTPLLKGLKKPDQNLEKFLTNIKKILIGASSADVNVTADQKRTLWKVYHALEDDYGAKSITLSREEFKLLRATWSNGMTIANNVGYQALEAIDEAIEIADKADYVELKIDKKKSRENT